MLTTKHLLTASAGFVAFGLMAANTHAATLLFDDFQDGTLGTATESGAVNGGFDTNSSDSGYTFVEENDFAKIEADGVKNSFREGSIRSSNTFDLTQGVIATWDIAEVSWDNTSNGARLLLEVGNNSGIIGNSKSPNSFLLEFNRAGNELDILAPDGSGGTATLFDDSGATLEGESGVTIVATLDANGYEVDISTRTSSISGTWSAGGADFDSISDANGLANVAAGFMNKTNPGTSDDFLNIDSISVVAIPEPATAALIGVGGLLMLRRRSRA
ncbi:MAG: PEP-CTERM sorting domain-containing protein [Phycisphaeraceae bacterium]